MPVKPRRKRVLAAQGCCCKSIWSSGRVNRNAINGLVKKLQDPVVFGAWVFTNLKAVPIS